MSEYDARTLNEYLATSGVPKVLREIKPDPQWVPAECWTFGQRMHEGSQLVLAGPVGTGKTLAALWVVRRRWHSLASQGRRVPRFSFLTARDLYRAVFDRQSQRLQNLRDVSLLVLDDLGATYDTDWPLDEMEGLLCHRADEGAPTIVTTNLNAERIQSVIPRAFSRLSAVSPGPGFITVVRPDMRQGET